MLQWILPHLLVKFHPVASGSAELDGFPIQEDPVFADVIHGRSGPAVAQGEREVEALCREDGVSRRHAFGSYPYVVEFVGIGVPDHEIYPVKRGCVRDVENAFGGIVGRPFMSGNGMRLLQDAGGCACVEGYPAACDADCYGTFEHCLAFHEITKGFNAIMRKGLRSEYVQDLFLGFFEFVLHQHDTALDLRIIGFGSGRVDLPSDLLQNE